MTSPRTSCLDCLHYNHDTDRAGTCKAFPDGIPQEIIFGVINHFDPLPNDNGLQFEFNTAIIEEQPEQ